MAFFVWSLQFLCALFAFYCIFWVHFFAFFMCVIMKKNCVDFLRFFVFLFFFGEHFLHFLLPLIVEVDISDIAKISGITNMVKAIILVINNTPQKTHRIAQYTDSWNRFHSLPSLQGA